MLNEFLVSGTTLCLVFCTDFVPNIETQYSYGFVMIGVVSLIMFINLSITINFSFYSTKAAI